ncbi:MAG: Calx-beta domain-containing protein, partial [Angelakisella sp.]
MEKGEKLSIVGKDGKTVTEDESWDKTFPYGTFAFERGDIVVGEGGAEVTLKLYRMGGTTGRASALISYDPVIAKMADGTGAYANAAGSKDITITVEDPLPIAQYQALGKDPEPLQPEKPVALVQGEYKGAESQPGDISLTPEIQADTYRWECLWGTQWKPVNGAVNREFVVSSADYPDFDYRCIYTVGEKTYCTNSAKGTVYVPAADEVLPAMPENMQLNPDPTYTTIQTDPNDDYLGYEFLMTFADGEFVKEIKLSSPEDNLAEAEKFGAFTIIDHEGGTLYDTANTVALHVVDNDAPEPCQLGFAIKDIEADKASGDAIITVVRTGGNQTVLTIDYATKDGTAIAGKDYMATSGTLKFYADADELKIVVPLVNDGVATEERSTFTIELSNLKGDKDKLCTLKETTANVNLWNSGKTEQANLATLLQDGGAEDISAGITEGTGSVAPVGVQPITGKQVIEEAAEPMTGKIEKGDTSLLTHMYAEPITFRRPEGDPLNNYWRDYRWFARNGQDYLAPWDVNAQGPDPFVEWELGGAKDGEYKAHSITSKVNSLNRLYVAGGRESLFEELYDSMQAYCEFTAEWVSDFDWAVRGGLYTFGGARLSGKNVTFDEKTCEPQAVKENGKWKLKYIPQQFLNASWTQNEEFDSVDLYTTMATPHESVKPAKSKLRSGILHRRSLENDLRLNIVTANDYDTKGDAEELSEKFYGSIKPTITVVPGAGGVTPNGKLYVGSTIKIDLTTAGGSYVTSNNANPYAVCLSDYGGEVLQTCNVKDNTATLTLAWDGMDLGRTYTVNVLMVRNQHMNLDIAPSVPRLAGKDNQQTIDPTKIAGAWGDFWKTTDAEG